MASRLPASYQFPEDVFLPPSLSLCLSFFTFLFWDRLSLNQNLISLTWLASQWALEAARVSHYCGSYGTIHGTVPCFSVWVWASRLCVCACTDWAISQPSAYLFSVCFKDILSITFAKVMLANVLLVGPLESISVTDVLTLNWKVRSCNYFRAMFWYFTEPRGRVSTQGWLQWCGAAQSRQWWHFHAGLFQ